LEVSESVLLEMVRVTHPVVLVSCFVLFCLYVLYLGS